MYFSAKQQATVSVEPPSASARIVSPHACPKQFFKHLRDASPVKQNWASIFSLLRSLCPSRRLGSRGVTVNSSEAPKPQALLEKTNLRCSNNSTQQQPAFKLHTYIHQPIQQTDQNFSCCPSLIRQHKALQYLTICSLDPRKCTSRPLWEARRTRRLMYLRTK